MISELEVRPRDLKNWEDESHFQISFKRAQNDFEKGIQIFQNSSGQFDFHTFWMWSFFEFAPHPLPCNTLEESKEFIDDLLERWEKLRAFQ